MLTLLLMVVKQSNSILRIMDGALIASSI